MENGKVFIDFESMKEEFNNKLEEIKKSDKQTRSCEVRKLG